MALLKSLFISAYCSYLFIICFFSVYQFSQTNDYSYLALFAAHLPSAGFFSRLFIKPIARTSALLLPWSISLLILSAAALFVTAASIPLLATNIIGWLLYLFWYSKFKAPQQPLQLNQVLPEFELTSQIGESVSSKKLLQKPCLLLFYRGNWCPLCMAQIKEVAQAYRQLSELGVNICLISPQSQQHTQVLANKFSVPMQFFIDTDLKAASKLGIKADSGTPAGLQALGYDSDTVRPTVLITGKNGELIYSDITSNYRVRPEPEDFIKVLAKNI